MDLQVDYNDIPFTGEDEFKVDEIEVKSVKNDGLGNGDKEPEEPDGYTVDLDDDDDEDMYFDDSPGQDTQRRQGGPVRDNNASSLTGDITDDNDIMFNPTQKLNFDDDSADDVKDDDLDLSPPDKHDSGDGEYFTHRPLTNGSDVAQSDVYGASANLGTDQGQNIRIIEGHDSSLVDDGSLAFGFNYNVQSQNVKMSNAPQPNQPCISSGKSDDSIHNLYDSLERVDGAHLLGVNNDNSLDNNITEYSNTGLMSLFPNSQGPECSDSVLPPDDNSDEKNYMSNLPHNQQHFHNNQCDNDQVRHQSPPRNFQVDASSINLNRRPVSGDNHMINVGQGGFGDGMNPMEDTDDLNLELSEEGLMNNAQMYAQPLAAVGQLAIGDNFTPLMGEHIMHLQNQHIQDGFNSLRVGKVNNLYSQPKNMANNQGHSLPELDQDSHHSEGDGVDAPSDERQAGAGSSSSMSDQNLNQSAGGAVGRQSAAAVRKSASGKVQTRRPAVQGSASSGNTKRSSSLVNPRPGNSNSAQTRRVVPPTSSAGRLSGTGDSVKKVSGGARKKVLNEGNNSSSSSAGQLSVAVHSQGVKHTQQIGLSSMTSRANSHSSLVSNASCTNSRMSGVGKESQQFIFRASPQYGTGADSPTDQYNVPVFPNSGSVLSLSNGKPNKSHSMDKILSNKPQIASQPSVRPSHSYGPSHPGLHFKHSSGSAFGTVGENQFPLSSVKGQTLQNSVFLEGGISQRQLLHDKFVQQHEQQALYLGHLQPQQSHNPNTSPCGSDVSHHSVNQDHVLSQMEVMKRQGQRLSPNEVISQRNRLEGDVHGMDEVRSHLQNMLQLSTEPSSTEVPVDQSDGADHHASGYLSDAPINRHLHFDTDVSSYLGNNRHEDMSDILENFPEFSSKIFADMPSNPSHTEAVHGEMQHHIRESLEKERYRRKHCEEQIQKLNSKLLETQQQLAVAVSTDKRKDIMIEQLDKQLAKVVEGWKKRESEKDEFIKVLTQEKEQIQETLQNQQKMINNFERDLSQTVEELRIEKEHSSVAVANVKKELSDVKQQMETSEAMIESERQKFSSVSKEWDELKQNRELSEQRAQQAQEQLMKEQDEWHTKEKELHAKINEVKEANQKVINMEKVKLEEQKKKREESEARLEEMKTELKRVVLDMEELLREKESQKVEMAIMEAKGESALRKLETDLHVQMEKEIADQAKDFHSKMESTMGEVADRHRKQIGDLHSRHQKDMEQQMSVFNQEMEKKEEEHRKQMTDVEDRLQETRNENSALKQSKLKLESQRMEILTKLQFMMQSQWNEAVSLLVSTPQKKNLNSSFLSSQASSQQLGSGLPATEGNEPSTSSDQTTSRPPALTTDTEEPRLMSSLPQVDSHARSGECSDREVEQRMDRVEEYLYSLPNTTKHPQQYQTREQATSKRGDLVDDSNGSGDGMIDNPAVSTENNSNHGYVMDQGRKIMYTSSNFSELPHQAVAMKPPHQSSSQQSQHTSAITKSQRESESAPAHLSHHHESQYTHHLLPTGLQSFQRDRNPLHHDILPMPYNEHQHLPHSDGRTVHQNDHRLLTPRDSQTLSHIDPSSSSLPQLMSFNPTHPSTSFSHNSSSNPATHRDERDCKAEDVADINIYHPEGPVAHNMTSIPGYSQWLLQGIGQVKHFQDNTHSQANALSHGSVPSQYSKESSINSSPVSSVRVSRSRTSSQTSARSPAKHTGRQQPVSITDCLNESLSPPVKQSAQRNHPEIYGEPSRGMMDESRLQANYNELSDRADAHENRHGELQHYVRMLLCKAPSSVYSEPERDFPSEILESSRDLTVDLDLNDTDQAFELNAQLRRLQHLRERQDTQQHIQHSHMMTEQPRSSQSRDSLPDYLNDLTTDNGVISSQRLSEISQYLSMYREQWESNPDEAGQQNVAGQLMEALKGMAVNVHKSDEPTGASHRKEHNSEDTSKSQQTKKSKDMYKVRKVKNANQSADTTVADSGGSDKSSTSRNSQTTRKVAQTQESMSKDRKQAGPRQSSSKNGGPVWK